MKRLSAIAMALALLLLWSPAGYPQAKEATSSPPSVAPTLVREGDLAMALVSVLEMGTAESETEAETILASAGIAPENGWISDYPVTPDILGELQDAVAAAADSNRLPMGKAEALEALESVSADLGLSVVAHSSGEYAENPPPVSPQYIQPTVINNYYYRDGPPVVTYYPPPTDYLYLYAWVPYPFWCSRFFFSGFFILHDFHKIVRIRNRVFVVSNHFFHHGHRRFFRVDPVKRRGRRPLRAVAIRTYERPLFTAEAHKGARSILQRSHDRMRSSIRLVDRNSGLLQSPIGSTGISRKGVARQIPTFNGRGTVKAKAAQLQKVQKAPRDSARSFTALGRNEGKAFNRPTAPGSDSPGVAPRMRTFNDRTGVRTKNAPAQEVQKARRNSARLFRAPGIRGGKSPSLSSKGERNLPSGLQGSSKGFPEKFFRKLPGGGSALKGVPRVPF